MPAKSRTAQRAKRTVSSAYARNKFGELLKEVAKGTVITVQRYNTPVAIISPPPRPEKRVPKFGAVKGIKIFDPNWADPMQKKNSMRS